MKTLFALLLAIPMLFATPISAGGAGSGGGVADGSYWRCGGDLIKIDVIQDPQDPAKVISQATSAGGFSGAAGGAAGADSTAALPTANSSGVMLLPNGDSVSIKGNRPYRKKPGKPWTPCKPEKPPKKPKPKHNSTARPMAGANVHGLTGSPSDNVGSLP